MPTSTTQTIQAPKQTAANCRHTTQQGRLSNEERIRALLDATPDKLAAVDAALTGKGRTDRPSLRLYRMGEAAQETGLSRVTLWRAIRDGRLKVVEIREGSFRIPECELRQFVGA